MFIFSSDVLQILHTPNSSNFIPSDVSGKQHREQYLRFLKRGSPTLDFIF